MQPWLSETEVMQRISRSKSWLRHIRNGVGGKTKFFAPCEIRNINGRSFRYSTRAIERLERALNKPAKLAILLLLLSLVSCRPSRGCYMNQGMVGYYQTAKR